MEVKKSRAEYMREYRKKKKEERESAPAAMKEYEEGYRYMIGERRTPNFYTTCFRSKEYTTFASMYPILFDHYMRTGRMYSSKDFFILHKGKEIKYEIWDRFDEETLEFLGITKEEYENLKKNEIKMATAFISGTFNAFAFAGAGFLFSKINKGDYEAEMKRHNRAMEELAKARDEWNQARLKEIDRIQNLRYKKAEGLKDIQSTNRDFLDVQSKFEKTEPLLSHFYKPSHQMQEYLNFVKFAATIPVLYGVSTLII